MSAHRPVGVAVVTIARDRRDHLRQQALSIANQQRRPDRYVIVDLGGPDPRSVIPDGLDVDVVTIPSDTTDLPLALARNVGYAHADADVTVFLDVDCIADPELTGQYADLVSDHAGVHAGPVGYLPHHAPRSIDPTVLARVATYQTGRPTPQMRLHRTDRIELFWSLSFAVDRSSWVRIGGFDERYEGYGGEDTDFARRADRADVPIWFSPRPQAFHQFHPVSSPPVEHLHAICRNATTFYDTWGSWPMIGWLSAFAASGSIDWEPSGSWCNVRVPVSAPATR
ncbi:MAG: galactosyltransferase-related protein [Ilumatobacteraceae bacterium]